MRDIGQRLKSMRSYLGIGQKEVAAAIGISQAAYSKLESGQIALKKDKLEAIAAAMKTSVDDIIHFTSPVDWSEGQEEYLLVRNKASLDAFKKEIAMLKNEILILRETINDKNRIIDLLESKKK